MNISNKGAHKNLSAQGSIIKEVQNAISSSGKSKEAYMVAAVLDKAIKGIPEAIQVLEIQLSGAILWVVISDTMNY